MQDFTAEIMRRVSEEIRLLDSTLVTGKGIKTMEQYQKLLGQREGLQACLDTIDNILTENEQAE